MKQKRLKNLLKLGFLLFGTSFVIISCQKDESPAVVEDLSLLKGFHFSTLSSIKERKKILNSTDKLFPSSNEMGRQNNNSYNFTIDTTTVQTLVAQNYISYTFIAQMNQPDSQVYTTMC